MDRFEAMRTLIAAVDGGSLSAASRTLSTPLPTVSRRVSDLEAHLGAQLVVRTSRKLILTEAGDAFVAVARRVIEELADAERAAGGEYRAPRGDLLVTAPIMFGKLHLAPIVHDFLGAYPEVNVRLVLSDSVIDLTDAQIDIAVRIGPLPDSDLLARRVGRVRWVTCASPDYLKRWGEPSAPADIAGRACVAFDWLPGFRTWSFSREGRSETVAISPRFSVNSADAVIEAAASGLGLARVTSYQAADAVREGRLVEVLRSWAPEPIPVHLLHRHQRSQPLKQRAFFDFVTPRLKLVLEEVGRALP